MQQYLSEVFWNEWFWLPKNLTWDHLSGDHYPKPSSILYSFIFAFAIFALHHLLYRIAFRHLGRSLGIEEEKVDLNENVILEKYYRTGRSKYDSKKITGLIKQLDWTEAEIVSWLKRRKKKDKSSKLDQFCCSCWELFYYTSITIFEFYIIKNESYIHESFDLLRNYPFHPISSLHFWYYNIAIGFYISMIIIVIIGPRAKDFKIMLLHHISTIVLLSTSWAVNFIRLGLLVSIIHDTADVFLHATKIISLLECHPMLINSSFSLLIISWIYSRLYLFPTRILYYTLYKFLPSTDWIYPYFLLSNTFLILLFIFHCIWSYILLNIVWKKIKYGKIEDIRD